MRHFPLMASMRMSRGAFLGIGSIQSGATHASGVSTKPWLQGSTMLTESAKKKTVEMLGSPVTSAA